jgi:hypothetical protein
LEVITNRDIVRHYLYVGGERIVLPDGVSLVYEEAFEDDYFHKFAKGLNQEGIPAKVDSRPNPGPQACIEWLMPTAIVAGVSAGFLNEIGKDLYQLLKAKIADLTIKTIQKPRIEPVMYGSKGKLVNDNPYSSAFSIYSDAKMNRRFKLLIPKYSLNVDYNKAVHAYLDFLKDYNRGIVSEIDIGLDLSVIRPMQTIPVCFNEARNCIEWVDHVPAHVRAASTST